jgi:hypothetical protein
MEQGGFAERCTPAIVLLLLIPIVLVFGVLAALGSGFDIFEYGEAPLALALCAPTLFVLLRYLGAGSRPQTRDASPPAEAPLGALRIPELL